MEPMTDRERIALIQGASSQRWDVTPVAWRKPCAVSAVAEAADGERAPFPAPNCCGSVVLDPFSGTGLLGVQQRPNGGGDDGDR